MKDKQKLVEDKGKINFPIDPEKFVKLLIDNLPIKIFWKDTESVYEGANRAFCELGEIPENVSIMGKSDLDMPWKDRSAKIFRIDDQEIMNSKEANLHIIEKIEGSEGNLMIKTSKIPLIDENGEVKGVLGFFWNYGSFRNEK